MPCPMASLGPTREPGLESQEELPDSNFWSPSVLSLSAEVPDVTGQR